jgi:hypothetical protein
MQRKQLAAANNHCDGTNIRNSRSQGCQGVKRKRAQAPQTTTIRPSMPPARKRDQACKQKREAAELIGGFGLGQSSTPARRGKRAPRRRPLDAASFGSIPNHTVQSDGIWVRSPPANCQAPRGP